MERVARIELAPTAWKAEVLPLNYTRVFSNPLYPLRFLHLPAARHSRSCVRNLYLTTYFPTTPPQVPDKQSPRSWPTGSI